MRCVTRQEQEREDAAMQTQQQLEVQKRADAEQQQRLEAETESLRSELKAARDAASSAQQQHDESGQQQQHLQLLEHQVTVLKASVARLEQVMRDAACMS